jgi:uncharacterized protein
MTRVVLDTNIFVSALLQPFGPPAKVFLLAITGSLQLCISGPVFAEYEEVIRRPRFDRSEAQIEAALRVLREKSLWVRPTMKIRACADPDDDIFLECAQTAKAEFLVTGNVKHFPAAWEKIRVVTARQFLDAIVGA